MTKRKSAPELPEDNRKEEEELRKRLHSFIQ